MHQLAPQQRNADPREPGRGGACRSTAFTAPLSSQGNHQKGGSRLPFLPSFSPLPPLLLTWPHLRAQRCMGPGTEQASRSRTSRPSPERGPPGAPPSLSPLQGQGWTGWLETGGKHGGIPHPPPRQGGRIRCVSSAKGSGPRRRSLLLSRFSRVRLFVTLWAVPHRAPSAHGTFQGRILRWVAICFSGGSSRPRD